MRTAAASYSSNDEATEFDFWTWVTRVALGLAIAMALCRSTTLEYLRDPFAVMPGTPATARAPGPVSILLLDLLAAVPALLVFLRSAVDERFVLRRSWGNVAMVLLGVWLSASVLWADDRFAAAIDAVSLCSAMSMLWAAQQLVRSWRHVRLVAAVAFGLLMLMAAHGAVDQLVELPARRENFRKNLPETLKQMNIQPGSFEANRIEQKITSGEMLGFSASINTFAAMMVTAAVVAAGSFIQRIKDREEPALAAVMALAFIAAAGILWFTDSRTAFLTPIIAAGLFLIYLIAGPWLNIHRRIGLIAAILIVATGTAFLVGYGVTHGTLFHDSLNFRWRYWVGAWGVWFERPFMGVGLNGFSFHYLAHRLPIASEEVKDPHNFVVRAFSELGLIGGVLTLVWISRGLWEMTRPATLPTVEQIDPVEPPRLSDLTKLSIICGVGMLLAMVATVDLAFIDGNTAIEALKRLLYLCVCVIGGAVVALRSMQHQSISDRPAPWIRAGMTIAVLVFLIHNLIDFSMFETSAMFFAALVAGTAWGIGMTEPAPGRKLSAVKGGAFLLVWLGTAAAIWIPIVLSESAADEARSAVRESRFREAAVKYSSALEMWPSNADYAFNAATSMGQVPSTSPREIQSMLDRAVAANPMNPKYYRVRAEYEMAGQSPDTGRVRRDYEAALRIDPNSVDMRLEYADALARLGQNADARREYETALSYNDRLDPKEPKRLDAAKLAEVREKIQRLR